MRIQKLSPHLANQIAAGEVVERSASIVKELLENSLDAGATQLTIYLYKGGIDGIDVYDNGTGIHPDDLGLSIQSHATSKISDVQNLFQINTFGFRGEALSSIHSVAKVTIKSKQADESSAWEMNHLGKIKPCLHQQGTQISVRELFYNIPARKHFLKSTNTEYRHCLQVIHRIALIHPHIGIQLYHEGKLVLDCKPETTHSTNRFRQLFGKEFAEHASPIDVQLKEWHLQGWLAPTTVSRKTTDKQYWYVNHRPVKDRLLSAATRRAYNDLMHRHSQPEYFLHIQLPSEQVDVNVHPGKLEVRFRDNETFSFIQSAITKQLFQSINQQNKLPQTSDHSPNKLSQPSLQQQTFHRTAHHDKPSNTRYRTRLDHQNFKNQFSERHAERHSEAKELFSAPQTDPQPSSDDVTENSTSDHYLGQAISFIHGAFIVATNAKGMVVVDAHAAHERIIYQRLKTQHNLADQVAQPFLQPVEINLNPVELVVAEELSPSFNDIGIKNEIQKKNWLIHSLPNVLKNLNLSELLKQALVEYAEQNHTEVATEHLYEILSLKACHQAVRANRDMSIHEMNQLLRQVEDCSAGERCNHGRPTWHQVTLRQLDGWFSRKS